MKCANFNCLPQNITKATLLSQVPRFLFFTFVRSGPCKKPNIMIFQAQTNSFTFPSGPGNTKIVLFKTNKQTCLWGQLQLPVRSSGHAQDLCLPWERLRFWYNRQTNNTGHQDCWWMWKRRGVALSRIFKMRLERPMMVVGHDRWRFRVYDSSLIADAAVRPGRN